MKIVSGADTYSKNGKHSRHLTSFSVLFGCCTLPLLLPNWDDTHRIFQGDFVICRRDSGRGVTFSSDFGRRYFRIWMLPIALSREVFVVNRLSGGRGATTIVSAAVHCVKIPLYSAPKSNSLSVGVNLAVSITNCC